MTHEGALQRIFLSRRTIAGWEQVGMSGSAKDKIRMLSEELQILDKLKADFPETAGLVEPLIARYQQLLLKTKLSLH